MTEGGVHNTISDSVIVGVVVQGGQVTLQLPAQITPAMAGLPPATPSFTGRADDLEAVLGVLAPHPAPTPSGTMAAGGGAVVVTAVGGMGGIGKTELSVQAARAALDRGWFGGGVLFVDMFGYDPKRALDANTAVAGFLRAMAVPAEYIPPDPGERLVLYRSLLEGYAAAGRPVLVFIDNVSSSGQAVPLLPGHPGCRAIITSRERLARARLSARIVDLDTLSEAEAVDLLHAAVQVRLPRDRRLNNQPDAVTELAGLCAGLPLALQIVAALLTENPSLSPSGLAAILRPPDNRLNEFDDGTDTLTAVFDLSYQRLPKDLQQLFALLPVNPGPALATAAAAALAGWDMVTTRRALTQLSRAHLIQPAPGDQRWQMHDLVRLYATKLSAPAQTQEEALSRLLTYYLTASHASDSHLDPKVVDPTTQGFPDKAAALAWLDTEYQNLIAAIRAAADHPGHQAIARDLPYALWHYLQWRRLFDDWIAVSTIAHTAAQRLGDPHGQATALNCLGIALLGARRNEEALTATAQAAVIYRDADDQYHEGLALNNLGAVLQELGRYEEAITAHQDAATIFQESNDRHREGMAWTNLARALMKVERFDEAIAAHQQSVTIYRETGDRHGEGLALEVFGLTLRWAGRYEEAITAHQGAATIYRETGDRHGEGREFNNLGVALWGMQRLGEAIIAHQRAVTIYRETGDRAHEALAWNNLAIVLRQLGRFEEEKAAAAQAQKLGESDRQG